ncbi:MAG: ATP-binding cassette domain-containing protein [Pseudomonadota bacterium]
MIEIEGAKVQFDDGPSFTFSLTVGRGERIGLIGPSGAGKSTLLSIIAGFLPLDAGRLVLDGVDHSLSEPAARPVTMMFQANNLFDHLDVATNVGLGISPRFKKKGGALSLVQEALAEVGLAGFEERGATGLSGGEAQRVALARALVRDKPILLLDEPFAALGPSMREAFSQKLTAMAQARGLTVLIVSHSPDDLLGLCDRLAFVSDRQIAAEGETAEMLDNPPTEDLARYLGRSSQRMSSRSNP